MDGKESAIVTIQEVSLSLYHSHFTHTDTLSFSFLVFLTRWLTITLFLLSSSLRMASSNRSTAGAAPCLGMTIRS